MALTGVEIELHTFHIDTIEQLLNVFGAELVCRNAEAKAVHTLVQDVQCLGIGFLGASTFDVLAHMPGIVSGLVATYVGELARQGVHQREFVHILLAVERFHTEPLIGPPHHFLLIIGTLEVNLNLVPPFLGGRGREIRKQFFFVICHDSCN